MSRLARLSRTAWTWLFRLPVVPIRPHQTIIWWESRRIPFNVFIAAWGIVCLLVFYLAIDASDHLKPGEDAVEPMALFLAPVLANACYTLGWIVEIAVRSVRPNAGPKLGPRLFRLGLAFSLLVISVPAVVWLVVLALQVVHLQVIWR